MPWPGGISISKLGTFLALIVVAVSYHVPWSGPLRMLKIGLPVGTVLVYHALRQTSLHDLGLSRPRSWPRLIGLAVLVAVLVYLFRFWLLDPMIVNLVGDAGDPSAAESETEPAARSVVALLFAILIGFTYGALIEEIVWRGFLLRETAVLFGDSTPSWIAALLLSAAAFGAAHAYQGREGILTATAGGLIYGLIYILRGRRDLWLVILVHGLVNAIGFAAAFSGVD